MELTLEEFARLCLEYRELMPSKAAERIGWLFKATRR